MLKVGITGGIGSGKTTITKVFKTFGIAVYNADAQAKNLMHNNHELRKAIQKAFGQEAYNTEGLNRQYLARVAFASANQTTRLNSIVHPAVAQHFKQWCKEQKSVYVLKEAALLIETGSYKQLDKLLVVTAPEQDRIIRVLKRDRHRNQADVQNIISKQLTDDKRIAHADFEIKNNNHELLLPKLQYIHKQLTAAAKVKAD
jgi:dephospho-CoA kinase